MPVNNGYRRFRYRGYISVFLAVALVAANMGYGLFRVDTRAIEQAAGQLGYYSIYCETSAQDCEGVSTDAEFKLRLEFDDGQVWYSNVLDDIADDNDQESDDNNTMFISTDNTDAGDDTSKWYAPAKPVTSVGIYQVTSGGGTWKWDNISVNYWAGSAWHPIATLGAGYFDTLEGTIDIPYNGYLDDNNYLLTFDGNGGTVNGEAAFQFCSEYGATLPEENFPQDAARTGYTFSGWDPSSLPLLGPSADTSFSAQWSINYYTITFDANGGSGGWSDLLAYDSVLTPPVMERAGYTFTGWSPSPPAAVPAADTTYVAQWIDGSLVNITFDANGGTGGYGPVSMTKGAPLTAPDVSRTGYTFTHWLPEVPAVVPNENTEYAANWSANTYLVAFDAQGGGTPSPSSKLVTYGSIYGTLATTLRTGYTLNGWYTASSGGTKIETTTAVITASNHTLYARWLVNSYTITFDANGGTGGWSRTMQYGADLTPPTVTRTGYTFTGWSPSPPITVPAANATYTAQWQINNYRMTFNPNNGSKAVSQLMPYNSALTAPVPERPGYTLAEWMPAVPATVPAADTEYTARWYRDGLSINLDLEAGRQDVVSGAFVPLTANEALSVGDIITVRIKPEADFLVGVTRYVVMFDRTIFSIIGENKGAFTPNAGNDFYAAVAPDYTATTNILDSAWPSTFDNDENYNYFKAVAVGNRANYTSANGGYPGYMLGNEWLFSFQLEVTGAPANGDRGRIWMDERWIRDSSNQNGLSYFAKCLPGQRSSEGDSVSYNYQLDLSDADLQLHIQEAAVQSTIYFNMNGGLGTVPDVQTGMPGNAVQLPAKGDIARQYYTFLGWAETADATQALSSYNFPPADATLYAVWQRVPVTLTKRTGSSTVFVSEAGVNYIYGLEEGLSEQAFRSSFVQFNGDGRLQITLIEGSFGTGTRVDLYDNVTNTLLKTYWIVIFGDVDGDGYVTAADENLIDAAASYQSEFIYGTAAFYAADIMQDGGVDALDLNIISAATSYTGIIDQNNPGTLIL